MNELKPAKYIFHGSCLDCLTQEVIGPRGCQMCQCYDADWSKPDLSTRAKTEVEIFKEKSIPLSKEEKEILLKRFERHKKEISCSDSFV